MAQKSSTSVNDDRRSMTPKLKALLRTVIGFLLAVVFLYLAFRGTSLSDLWNSLLGANYLLVSLLIPVTIIGFWLRMLRWEYLLSPIKSNMSRRNLFSAVMIGYMVNNVLPRVGELMRPYVIGRLENISKSSAFGSVVVERILDFMTFYLLVVLVMVLYPGMLDPFINYFHFSRPLLITVAATLFFLFVFLFFKGEPVFKVLSGVSRILPQRTREKVDRIRDSFLSAFGVAKMREHFAAIVILSLLLQATYAAGLYIPFFAFDAITQLNLDFGASVVLLTISSIAYVLPAPGAMGTYHSLLTLALVNLYNADRVAALSFSIVTHEVGYIVTMIVGLTYFLKDHVRVSEVTLQTAEGDAR
ncbi:MAG: flippase-like domain-containing protein [Ignavibacteriales bacterium]|nr:flippase-like domain-containing protein [Ignavibacteriales bacterium]